MSLQCDMLNKLHQNHYGPDSSIWMAKDKIYWTGMQAAIRDMYNNCTTCAKYLSANHKVPMLSHSTPALPLQIVSQDLFHWDSNNYLITVDHCSDFFKMMN